MPPSDAARREAREFAEKWAEDNHPGGGEYWPKPASAIDDLAERIAALLDERDRLRAEYDELARANDHEKATRDVFWSLLTDATIILGALLRGEQTVVLSHGRHGGTQAWARNLCDCIRTAHAPTAPLREEGKG